MNSFLMHSLIHTIHSDTLTSCQHLNIPIEMFLEHCQRQCYKRERARNLMTQYLAPISLFIVLHIKDYGKNPDINFAASRDAGL